MPNTHFMKTRILILNTHFMKTKILLLLMAIPFLGYAQGDLQFSQAKLVNATETVPAGMVWKVTNVMPSTESVSGTNNLRTVNIKVNGISIIIKATDFWRENNIEGITNSAWTTLSGPYWLPAGTTLAADVNCVYISILEFSTQ